MKTFKRHNDYGFWDQNLRLKLGEPLYADSAYTGAPQDMKHRKKNEIKYIRELDITL
jgi:hypothetical protein